MAAKKTKKLDLVVNKEVSFDQFTHTYLMGDKLLTGVTSLMRKHGLAADYSGVDEEILMKAAERGTAIHQLLEDYDNGEPVVETPEVKAYKKLGLKVSHSEYLISDNELVASSIDKVLSDCSIADIKTTYEIHVKSVTWQTSIYAYLFEKQNPGLKVPHLYVVHVRDGKATVRELNRIPDESIRELLDCEREGRLFVDDKKEMSTDLVLTREESETLVKAWENVIYYNQMKEEAEARMQAIKTKLYDYMEEHNIDKIECDGGIFTRKASSTREGIDAKKFKAEHPAMYERYKKVTGVKGSLLFKSKNK